MTRPRFRGLTLLAATLAFSLASTTPASADFPDVGHVYDTVDAVQSGPFAPAITITGIIVGQSTATTSTYELRSGSFTNEDPTARCDRFALLAMAKPGKYQFATVAVDSTPHFDCKLTVRTP